MFLKANVAFPGNSDSIQSFIVSTPYFTCIIALTLAVFIPTFQNRNQVSSRSLDFKANFVAFQIHLQQHGHALDFDRALLKSKNITV